MDVTKDLDKKIFDYIDPWGENLSSIAWTKRDSYHHTNKATPCKAVFGREIIFNLASVLHWRVITSEKQRQVEIDKVRENALLVTHDDAVRDIVSVEVNGIYHKIYNKKHEPYIIKKVFTNCIVQVKRGKVDGHINIRRLRHHFFE